MALYDDLDSYLPGPTFGDGGGGGGFYDGGGGGGGVDLEELLKPMSDAQVAERLKRSIPYWNDFSPDAFLAADPELRTIFADAYIEGEGDPIALYGTLNDELYQEQLIESLLPRTHEITGGEFTKLPQGFDGDEEKSEAREKFRRGRNEQLSQFGNAALENIFASSVPSAARNIGLVDLLSQRYGGRPYPGAGTGIPGYSGPGYGQVGRESQAAQTVADFRARYGNRRR